MNIEERLRQFHWDHPGTVRGRDPFLSSGAAEDSPPGKTCHSFLLSSFRRIFTMRRRFLATALFLAAWPFLGPACWVGAIQAQTITPLTVGGAGYTDQLTASSYTGGNWSDALQSQFFTMFSNASLQAQARSEGVGGVAQNWYSVGPLQNQTYVISLWNAPALLLSIQDNTGTQIAWNLILGEQWLGNGNGAQVAFQAQAGVTYTIIVTNAYYVAYGVPTYAFGQTYTVTVANPTPTGPQVTTIPSLATTYTNNGQITSNSFYGTASGPRRRLFCKAGSPIPLLRTGSTISNSGMSRLLCQRASTRLTMTPDPGYTGVLSIQSNTTGAQVGYATGSPATINFAPTATDTYSIICSTTTPGPGPVNFQLDDRAGSARIHLDSHHSVCGRPNRHQGVGDRHSDFFVFSGSARRKRDAECERRAGVILPLNALTASTSAVTYSFTVTTSPTTVSASYSGSGPLLASSSSATLVVIPATDLALLRLLLAAKLQARVIQAMQQALSCKPLPGPAGPTIGVDIIRIGIPLPCKRIKPT